MENKHITQLVTMFVLDDINPSKQIINDMADRILELVVNQKDREIIEEIRKKLLADVV